MTHTSTLLLALVGIQQSWNPGSHLTYQGTMSEPSKSGVCGLIAAALGRPRQESIADIAALRMGVRVDRAGFFDQEMFVCDNTITSKMTTGRGVLYYHSYLSDAAFLVGLEGRESFLKKLFAAVTNPVWPIFLGRKAYIPSRPVAVQVVPTSLEIALRSAEPLLPQAYNTPLLMIVEDPSGMVQRLDYPTSSWPVRSIGPRWVRYEECTIECKEEETNAPVSL